MEVEPAIPTPQSIFFKNVSSLILAFENVAKCFQTLITTRRIQTRKRRRLLVSQTRVAKAQDLNDNITISENIMVSQYEVLYYYYNFFISYNKP